MLTKFKKGCKINITAEMFLPENIPELKSMGFEYKESLKEHKFFKKLENVAINIVIRNKYNVLQRAQEN